MDLPNVLIVIGVGSFVAAFINAAFATGGVYILLASSSAVLPLTVAVPLQSVFAFSSLLARVGFFRAHIYWPIVAAFSVGALIGVALGAQVFVMLSEFAISLSLGLILLVLIWWPAVSWRIPLRYPFFPVGIIHSFIGTLFGVGTLLQPLILRTRLLKLQITGTTAACLVSMEIFKITGYSIYGFDYRDYYPHIALATLMGFVGTWTGKQVGHRVSETVFRRVFKLLITAVALRLLWRAWQLF